MKSSRLWYVLAAMAVLVLAVRVSSGHMGDINAIFTDRETSNDNRIMAGVWNDPGLVLDLECDEGAGTVANDSSIYGNNGAITGATWTTNPPYEGFALDFDGSGDRVIVPNSPSLQFDQALTLEAWVKTDTIASGVTRIVDRVGAIGSQHWTLYRSGNRLIFQILTSSWATVTGPATLVTDTWYHVAATYDGAFARLFVDGVEIASAPISGPIGVGQTYLPIAVGAWVRTNGDVFDGTIDRARLYNRALTPAQILQQYHDNLSTYVP